jgi:predicted nucleic acid-binding protein
MLGDGEAHAISLAKQLSTEIVLLDDAQARRVAIAHSLVVVRTLALLEFAAERGLIELPDVPGRLSTTTFRLPKEHIALALMRDSERRMMRRYRAASDG